MSSETARYGEYYWCVGLTPYEGEDKSTEVYVMADLVEADNGVLTLWGKEKEDGLRRPNLIFAKGEWKFVYAASLIDGHAVAIEHWPGQING